MACGWCDGKGWVQGLTEKQVKCDHCDGKGESSSEQERCRYCDNYHCQCYYQ